MKNKEKYFTPLEAAEEIRKSMYRAVVKAIKSKSKPHYEDNADEVIRDVTDPNYVAEVDPDEIPAEQHESVVWKSKSSKSKKKKEKGVKKLKKFMDRRHTIGIA